ncbi:MAG: hypothetical protein ACRDZ6_07150 [Acidimicrobiales bacterium]
MSLRKADVDRLVAPEYVEGLADAPVAELRTRRDECLRTEVVLSYLRRVLQGEHDLVRAEMNLRASGSRGDLGRLVEDLPAILSASSRGSEDRRTATSAGHLSLIALPGITEAWSEQWAAELEELIATALSSELVSNALPGGNLPGANLAAFSDQELVEVAEQLSGAEASISSTRHHLHERIDELQAAIVQRYKSGAADVDSLLT